MIRVQWLACWGTAILLFANLPNCLLGEDLELLEARNAWRSYLSKLGSVKGTIKSSLRTVGSQLITSNTVEVAVGRDTRYQKTLISASNANSPVISTDAFVKNATYAFKAGKPAGTEAWGLTGLAFISSKEEDSKSFVQSVDKKVQHLLHLFSVTRTSLENLAAQPNFKIVATSNIEKNGRKLVQVEFTNIHPLEHDETNVQKGVLVLDPNAFWCIASGEIESLHSDGTQINSISNEYKISSDGVPVPIRTTHHYRVISGESKGKDSVAEIESSLQRMNPPVSDSEFTLSAFGLPEPASNFQFPVSLSVALAILGVVLVSMALYIRRRGDP